MKINSLNLLFFRNYTQLDLKTHPKLNILVGENANGKTNIIEAIFLLALGKSYRTKSDNECIKFLETATCVSCEVEKTTGHFNIMLAINNKGKNAKISGVKKNKLTDFVGELNVVLFSPEDMQLIKGQPALRREFIDREFYQISKIYHKYSLIYKHLLKQRNAHLKEMKKNNDEASIIYLETITNQLAKVALYITKERYDFVKKITTYANENMLNISNGLENLEIKYKSSIFEALNITSYKDEKFNEKNLTEVMMKKSYDDIFRGNTQIGVHHDDLTFLINSLDAKTYASQGQQRSVVLSLRLAEINFLKEKTNEYPILLLDDVLSELDKKRQLKLLEAIDENIQTFITTPTLTDIKDDLVKNSKVFYINNGEVTT